jgi:hypothetical protein
VVLASVKEEAATGKPLLLTTLLLAATGHASDALALPLALAREHEGGSCSAQQGTQSGSDGVFLLGTFDVFSKVAGH